MFKKTLSILLCAAMVLSVASCGKPASAPSSAPASTPASSAPAPAADPRLGGLTLPLTDTPTKIEWVVTSSFDDLSAKWFAQKVKELTNVEIVYTAIPQASEKEKAANLIASKDLPDILGSGLEMTMCNQIGQQGGFAAVDDYLHVMPNFKAKVVDNPELNYYLKANCAGNGKLYGLQPMKSSRSVNHGMMYRKDIFDKNGIKVWTNTEEFYQAMKKLKEIYPNSYPFTTKTKANVFKDMSVSWGLNGFDMFYDETAGKWALSSTDARYKDMLDNMKKWYDEGLIDPEFLTLTPEQWESKMTQEAQSFITWDWIDRMNLLKKSAEAKVPAYDLRYAPPVGPTGNVIHLPDFSGWINSVAAGPNAELCFKLLDFMYSDYGIELATMGVEGETYKMGANGKAEYLDMDPAKTVGILDLEEKYGLFQQCTYKGIDQRSVYFTFTEPLQEAQDLMVKNNKIAPLDPALSFSDADAKEKNTLLADIMKKGEEFSFKYMFSKTPAEREKLWTDWQAAAKQAGADRLVEIYNNTQASTYGK